MRTLIVSGVLIVLTALAGPARAAENTPNPTNSGQREFNAKVLVCNVCHGENGVPKSAAIPIIAGQQEQYLLKQLHDFRSGDRKFESMDWMTNTLTAAEQEPAASIVAKKSWPAKRAGGAAPAAPRGIAVCQSCHSQNYMGAQQAEGMTTPRLAGQSYEYLVESMRRFAESERTNNADMVQIMKGISAADRDAMAKYLSSL